MSNYSSLARFYDSLTGNVDYVRRADFVVNIFGRSDAVKIILDAGCGTGSISRLLIDKGYDVIGVDNSTEMLSAARDKNPEQLLLCQDLAELDLYGTVQGIVCFQDTLNHFQSLDDVLSCLEKFSLFIESGCYLIFDINTLYKYSVVQKDNSFVFENDEVLCIWRNEYNSSDNSINMQLDFFFSDDDINYSRESEIIREIYIPDDWIREKLNDLQFDIESVIDGDTYDQVNENTERLMYTVKKR